MATKTIKEQNKKLEEAKRADIQKLSEEDKESLVFFKARKEELTKARQRVQKGRLETIWKAADIAYVPHEIEQKGKRVLASDDELGWRSQMITLGEDNWEETSLPTNPYVKIQTALGILIDRNPKSIFKPRLKKFKSASLVLSKLYEQNWDVAQSKQQLKLVVFNGSKYGIIAGRTYPKHIRRKVRNLIEFDPKDPSKSKYDEVEQDYYDDVYREAMNPWHCWFDDMAKPYDVNSMNDWMWFKDYAYDTAKEQFGHLAAFKYVKPQSSKSDEFSGQEIAARENVVRIWFYENLSRDLFFASVLDGNEVVIVNEPIPREPENKRLSCWVAPWTIRDQNTIYGIGTYEAMKNNYKMYSKVRNMTVNQLVASIYKGWFHEGTNMQEGSGIMKMKPGVGQQVSNAKNITFIEVPPPGIESWKGLEWIESKMDEDTGITKTLEGELSPKAKAFDIAQAREAGLKRLKTPLDNIAFGLEQDSYISAGLFDELYSIPEIEEMIEPDQIMAYKESLQEQGREATFEEVQTEQGVKTNVKVHRQTPLNIDRDVEGNIIESEDTKFFNNKPGELKWEGIVDVKAMSIIVESPLLERQETLELSNLIIPLFMQPFEVVGKAATQLLKAYKKEPKDWFPENWLNPQPVQEPQLFTPIGQKPGMQQGGSPGPQRAQTVVPTTQVTPPTQRSLVSKASGLMRQLNPFQ